MGSSKLKLGGGIMLKKNIFSEKVRYLVLGMAIGGSLMTSTLAFAYSPVAAWVENNIKIYFNGELKELPDKYEVLSYNGRTYTPARFIAEELGATVDWDEDNKSIYINYVDKETDKEIPEVDEEIEKEEEKVEDEKEEVKKPQKYYQKLPVNLTTEEARIAITGVTFENNETKISLEIEGKENYPIQFRQSTSRIETEDNIYKHSNLKSNVVDPVDVRWYNDIRKDDRITGWIKLPPMPEDTKEMTLFLEIFRNDGIEQIQELEIDIAL